VATLDLSLRGAGAGAAGTGAAGAGGAAGGAVGCAGLWVEATAGALSGRTMGIAPPDPGRTKKDV